MTTHAKLAGDAILSQVIHPILLFLIADVVALFLVGAFAAAVPLTALGFLLSGFSGLGAVLCIPFLLMRMAPAVLSIPIGPPGLALHLALNSLSAYFLFVVLLAAAVVAAVQSPSVLAASAAPTASARITAFCTAGTALSLLAADGVGLTIGIALTCTTIWLPQAPRGARAGLLIPLLLLAAICLLTPAGFAPRFDTIRAAPVDPDHVTAAVAMTLAALIGLVWSRPWRHCPIRDTLVAGMIVPAASYLLLRLVTDLPGPAAQTYWGFTLLLSGGITAVIQGWRSAADPDIDTAVACLTRRQAGLAMIGVGLALVARTADLPGAASFAFAATLLSAIGSCMAGCVASLAVQAAGSRTGTYRLARLGGLIHRMPWTSAALAAGLLGLAAVPPGFGFACFWLLFQSILSAPRASGLLFQLPLALVAVAVALSSALATVASVRLIGIAVLGRPRTPQGAGAQEDRSPGQIVLLVFGSLSLVVGVLPGPVLWLLADPAIQALTGAPPGSRLGIALLSSAAASPGYLALPVLGLLALATGAVVWISRRPVKDVRTAGFWADGLPPPNGLPFGDPASQSAGAGFVPTLPKIRLPQIPKPRALPALRRFGPAAGLWLLLVSFGTLLLALSVAG